MPQAWRELRLMQAGLLAAVVLGLIGCGRRSTPGDATPSSTDSAGTVTGYENPAAVPHPTPAQPSGPQVGRMDRHLNSASPMLAEWTAMWGGALEGFSPDSLWLVSRRHWSLAGGGTRPPLFLGEGDDSQSLARQLLSLRSPSRRFALSVDSYQAVMPSGDSLEVGGEPDSRCSLIDIRDSTEFVLMQTGTGGGYHWGAWLSEHSFAVGGWNDADDYSQWKQGRLWMFSLRDSTVTEYETRIVSAEAYLNYEARWHDWLLARYRAMKRTRPAP